MEDAQTRAGRVIVVGGLAVAGGIHLAVAARHPATAHLVFFALIGAAQSALAIVIARGQPRTLRRLAALISIAAIATWAATRTGVGTAAVPVGVLDAAATAAEAATAVAAVALLWRAHPAGLPRPPRQRQLAVAAVVLVAAGAAALIGPAHHHSHPRPPPSAEPARPKVFGDLFDHHPIGERPDHDAHVHQEKP